MTQHSTAASIKDLPFFHPDGKPLKSWKLFTAPTWEEALDAAETAVRVAGSATVRTGAGTAAWEAGFTVIRTAGLTAAWDATRDVARDLSLYVMLHHICRGLELDPKHVTHASARWRVWQKGYGLMGDVNGVLYVYAQKDGK